MGRADSISKKVNPRRQPASALSWTAPAPTSQLHLRSTSNTGRNEKGGATAPPKYQFLSSSSRASFISLVW